jgi:hypothetical protein
MVRLPMPDPLRHLPLDGKGGWLLVAFFAAEVLIVTRTTGFPNGSGAPYWAVWPLAAAAVLLAASLFAARFRPTAPRLRPVEAMAILAVTAMVMTDITMAWQPMRDLGIYLKAGQHFLAGSPVYLQSPLTVQPVDLTEYPYLYPPFTLPFFGALSRLPVPLVQAIWLGGSLCLGLLALRWIGLPGRWAVLALIWPPLFQGLWVGNVAVPALALFALGPWLGAGLVLGAAFKSYTGIAALWLFRERRWLEAGAGVGALVALAAATLPLTGPDLWGKWLDGLRVYQSSQASVPSLYGFGLPRYVPYAVFLPLAVVTVIAALRARGRESLARLGTATIVASPSLFSHGLLVAVPSLLSLRSPWLWLAIGFVSTPSGPHWLLAVGVVALSWTAPAMRRPPAPATATGAADPLHPLGATGAAWPGPRRDTEPSGGERLTEPPPGRAEQVAS